MKIKTNPTSRAYSYCWVEGLTATVVIDETTDARTVRVTTDYDPSIDPRMFTVLINGHTVAVGTTQVGGGGGSGRKRTPANRSSSTVSYSDGEVIVERSAAAIAAFLRDQPHADFSGEGPATVITAAADLLEELQARIDNEQDPSQ